jgi:predicted porin
MPAISTNLSYLGVRGFQRLPGVPFNFVYQAEAGFDVSASPGLRETNSNLSQNVNGALFSRNTYIGLSSREYGAIKIGKTTSPYRNSTAAFNPFAGQIGDYAVVMGNTGGDNRVEFGTRLSHAIWYESPSFAGIQWNLLFSPGQNRSDTSDNIPPAVDAASMEVLGRLRLIGGRGRACPGHPDCPCSVPSMPGPPWTGVATTPAK